MRKLLWLAWCVFCAACAGTETGNPSFEGSLGYDAYSSSANVTLQRAALSGEPAAQSIDVDSAWLVLGAVSFVPERDCDGTAHDDAHTADALGAGDHVHGQAPTTQFSLITGSYCGVRLPLLESGNDVPDAPDGLPGHSLLVSGTLEDGRKFELRSALRDDLVLTSTTPGRAFTLDPDHAGVLIGFDIAYWLDGLAWDEASVADDGVILADESHNTELQRAFEARVPAGVGLFRDADHDGLLDDDRVQLARGAQ